MKIPFNIFKVFLSFIIISLPGLQRPIVAQRPLNIQKIDEFLRAELKKSNIPGFSIVIVNRSNILFSKGYGTTSDNPRINGDTPFPIASLSKAFTAMAIMQLVEKNKINLDSAVSYYLPSFPLRSYHITVRQLLNQTSGLSDKVFPELKFRHQPANLDEAIDRMNGVKLKIVPGAKFQYHNPNYQIFAKLVEITSGKNFATYLRENIFYPLGMSQTFSFTNTNDFYSRSNLNEGYTFLFGFPHKMKEFDWFVEGPAGLVSTANDMAKWMMLTLNKGRFNGTQLLDEDSFQEMITPPIGTKSQYGMGWYVDQQGNLSHNGIFWTYQSEQKIMFDKGIGIVILFNSGLNAFQDYHSFMQGITDILDNKTPEVRLLSPVAYGLMVAILIIIALYFGVKRIKRTNQWYEKFIARPKYLSWIYIFLRLIPMIMLIAMPELLTLISGRVLSWERMFWIMPDVFIWIGIVAFLNVFIVLSRLKLMRFKKFAGA